MFKHTPAFSSFSVDDVAKAKHFYGQVLGMEVKEESEMDMLRLKLLSGAEVMVYPKGPAHAPASFTVLNFVVGDLDKTVDELAKAGVSFEHYDMPDMKIKTDDKGIARGGDYGPDIAWFKDPAGNTIAVMQDTKA